MKTKNKRTWLTVLGALICVALIIGIAGRFTAPPVPVTAGEADGPDPVGDIQVPDIVGTRLDIVAPVEDADSEGTEQTIQRDPVKPTPPPTPEADEKDVHDKTAPPEYSEEQLTVKDEEEPPAVNEQGQVYVPGFGYITSGGASTITPVEGMYENGNKIGIMG